MLVTSLEDIVLTRKWQIWRHLAAYGVIRDIMYEIYLGFTIKICTFAAKTTNNKEK